MTGGDRQLNKKDSPMHSLPLCSETLVQVLVCKYRCKSLPYAVQFWVSAQGQSP